MSENDLPSPADPQPGVAGAESQPAHQAPRTLPDGVPPGSVQVTLRRAPRFVPFILSGAVLGVAIALIVVALRGLPDQDVEVSTRAVFGYLGSIGGLLGGLAGAALAVLIDRRRPYGSASPR